MENHNKHSAYASELIASLTEDKMSVIDFDQLKRWLTEIAAIVEEFEKVRSDINVLRQDYTNRMGGMVKAMAAVNRHPDGWENALTYLENLSSLSASELIEQYRRTSARFRDAFPASFGLSLERKRGTGGLKDLSVFK